MPSGPRSGWPSGRVTLRPKWTRQFWESLLSPFLVASHLEVRLGIGSALPGLTLPQCRLRLTTDGKGAGRPQGKPS